MMESHDLFDSLAAKAPLALSTRLLLEKLLQPEFLDDVFERNAQEQYTRSILFSDVVILMGSVIQRMHPSVHAAFHKSPLQSKVKLSSFYDKLNGTEPAVSSALVTDHAKQTSALIDKLDAKLPPLIPGFESRIIDGNAIAATEHRLEVLRDLRSGALPGKSLVILDYERDVVSKAIFCEDGHAQERSLSDELLAQVHPGEVEIADRNFCTAKILTGIDQRGAKFVIREHRLIPVYEETPLELVYKSKTETLQEQQVFLEFEGYRLSCRRVILTLAKPTRDGDLEIVILTTVPSSVLSAQAVMDTYRKRWRIETMFRDLTLALQCEIPTLGNPRAALFAFAVALVSANTLAAIRAGLRSRHGNEVEEKVSIYQIVDDLQSTYKAVDIWEDKIDWEAYRNMPFPEFIAIFLHLIDQIDLARYRKAKTRPRKPRGPRGSPSDPPHVSTYKLLQARKEENRK
jgi:IS4 transposase